MTLKPSALPENVWGMKLGSAGAYVKYCQSKKPQIIGIGWQELDPEVCKMDDWRKLREGVAKLYKEKWKIDNAHSISQATTQIYYFYTMMRPGDLVWYYYPGMYKFFLTRVTSKPKYRDFDLAGPESQYDIWHYREVENAREFSEVEGDLYARIRHPKQTIWNMTWAKQISSEHWTGLREEAIGEEIVQIENSYKELIQSLTTRLQQLDEKVWDLIIADFFRKQGAEIIGQVGGNRPIFDVEAEFGYGLLPAVTWKVQVKRYTDRHVDWPEVNSYASQCQPGEHFAFVSVFGFTDEARKRAEDETNPIPIHLIDADEVSRGVLKYGLSLELKNKLNLPDFVIS